jgi:hypothetical protein
MTQVSKHSQRIRSLGPSMQAGVAGIFWQQALNLEAMAGVLPSESMV